MKFVHKFEEVFGGTILAAMAIITFLAAVNRFTFNFPMPWSEEIVKFLLMWMTMIGAALGIGRSEHVGIDVFVERFPQKMQFINRTDNVAGRSGVFRNLLLYRISYGNKTIRPEVHRP